MIGGALVADAVVTDQDAERLAAGHAEFVFIYLMEKRALIEFQSALDVPGEFGPGGVEHADFDAFLGIAVFDEIMEPPPGRFELLKTGMMENAIDLPGDELIESGYGTGQQILEFSKGFTISSGFTNQVA